MPRIWEIVKKITWNIGDFKILTVKKKKKSRFQLKLREFFTGVSFKRIPGNRPKGVHLWIIWAVWPCKLIGLGLVHACSLSPLWILSTTCITRGSPFLSNWLIQKCFSFMVFSMATSYEDTSTRIPERYFKHFYLWVQIFYFCFTIVTL